MDGGLPVHRAINDGLEGTKLVGDGDRGWGTFSWKRLVESNLKGRR